MKHPTEDTLLASILETLEPAAAAALQEHLAGCESCRRQCDQLRQETELIGSLEPEIARTFYPLPPKRQTARFTWVKVAALVTVGFLAGYGAAHSSGGSGDDILQPFLDARAPDSSFTLFFPCESVDTAVQLDSLTSY
ncbi:MAG: zf-HC2 domain-containing protein [bacterium]